ncbi:hypothetical protein BC939DRAFT_476118 [Gamsiella multidivaricata]|uniref:uncharacterized protein n=1 Tax=Gamsiella multidivaricata TaxID=101098 RepID=UPI00221F997F|nr:uncharacterized protein BC939DRAFT_476118 [Gamsiella multidivaricata]KAI7825676.1 hypothetical protein BC939DRAFT_476118 [Gamsiella multidivaricata]
MPMADQVQHSSQTTMGIESLWPFLRKKGYELVLHHQSSHLLNLPNAFDHNSAIRFDILGSFYVTIRYAYSPHPMEDAHCIEREVRKLGIQASLFFYLDGDPSEEKRLTQVHRKDLRKFFVYDVPSAHITLDPSLVQFTVLGIVFKNDYSRNIPSLGSATNYKVIKELDGEEQSSKVGGETDADDYDGQEKAEKEQEKDVGDLERKDSDHLQFHTVLLHNLHIYDSIVTTNAVGKHVQQFVDRAADFMLLQRRNDRGAIVARKPYPATDLLRSVASQLLTEVKKQYRNGSIELEKKPKTLNAKGLVSDGVCTEIDQDIPAIENIVLLNQSSKSYRKTALLTSMEQPFISLSEREFGCAPDQIKVLDIDLGQACVLGASALLPKNDHSGSTTTAPRSKDADVDMSNSSDGDGLEFINDIETSFESYVTELERVDRQLNEFYNGNNRFKKHK